MRMLRMPGVCRHTRSSADGGLGASRAPSAAPGGQRSRRRRHRCRQGQVPDVPPDPGQGLTPRARSHRHRATPHRRTARGVARSIPTPRFFPRIVFIASSRATARPSPARLLNLDTFQVLMLRREGTAAELSEVRAARARLRRGVDDAVVSKRRSLVRSSPTSSRT